MWLHVLAWQHQASSLGHTRQTAECCTSEDLVFWEVTLCTCVTKPVVSMFKVSQRWSRHVSPKCQFLIKKLRVITSQKTTIVSHCCENLKSLTVESLIAHDFWDCLTIRYQSIKDGEYRTVFLILWLCMSRCISNLRLSLGYCTNWR